MCDSLGIDQPEWSQFAKLDDALAFAKKVRFPVLVRPSYVLSGAAMRVIDTEEQLRSFLETSAIVQQEFPVVISKYISGAREIEFDAIGNKGAVVNYAISEHVEHAGTHSGDATLILPAQGLKLETHRRVMHIASQLCQALHISGPFNVQFMAMEGCSSSMRAVKVIECNVRASRTTPFVSKTLNLNFIELATRVMLGQNVQPTKLHLMDFEFTACKVAMFSFLRLSGADPRVGVEMQSTGEVACFGRDPHEAFLKAMIAAGLKLPRGACGVLVSLGNREDKRAFVPYVELLVEMGYRLYATRGTASFLDTIPGLAAKATVNVVHSAGTAAKPNVISIMEQDLVKLVINTPTSRDSGGLTPGYLLRRRALDSGLALMVDLRQAMMLVDALYQVRNEAHSGNPIWSIESWQECHKIARSVDTLA
jgi:hypothetical protein